MRALLFLSLIFSSSAYAFDCQKATVDTLAREAIMQELSGVHISELEGSECLKQDLFPSIRLVYDPSTERNFGPEYLVEQANLELKIKTELRDAENHVYKASYTISKVNKIADKTTVDIQDELEFFLYNDAANQAKYGCAAVITPPQNRVLFRNCQKKE